MDDAAYRVHQRDDDANGAHTKDSSMDDTANGAHQGSTDV